MLAKDFFEETRDLRESTIFNAQNGEAIIAQFGWEACREVLITRDNANGSRGPDRSVRFGAGKAY